MEILENHSLLKHNTFAIDAKAARFVEYGSLEELHEALTDWKRSAYDVEQPLPRQILFIGHGSNLVFTKDYGGTVFHGRISDINIISETLDEAIIRAGAAVPWDDFVKWSIEHAYYGAENLSGIPGEVGAAAVQNIGAYGAEVSNIIHSVETLSIADLKCRTFTNKECRYSYRHSFFKEHFEEYAVHHVVFRLKKKYCPLLKYGALKSFAAENDNKITALQTRDFIMDMRNRKLPPIEKFGSAGSFFMNPVVSEEKADELLKTFPTMPHYKSEKGEKLSAAWLIDQSGWKGRRTGNVGTYPMQPLVIVNYGGATAKEILDFSNAIIADVYVKFGIKLCPEAQFI